MVRADEPARARSAARARVSLGDQQWRATDNGDDTDVTETKKLELQFLRAQRLEGIGTLASGIAHDLNNILSPILMSCGILRREFKDEDTVKMLNIIEGSAERGAGIVKQVLTFARGVEGERVLLQLKHLVSELSKVMAQTFPCFIEPQLAYFFDIPPSADRSRRGSSTASR